MSEAVSYEVKVLKDCARCGREHEDLTFEPLDRPSGERTHWCPCPTNGQPILMIPAKVPPQVFACRR